MRRILQWPRLRNTWFFWAGLSLAVPGEPNGESAGPSGWQLLERGMFNDALEVFEQVQKESRGWEDFGRAMALINANPVTASRVAAAEAILGGLSTDRSDADLAMAALFMRGRLAEWHLDPPQYDRAIALYSEVIDAFPGALLSGEALISRSILLFFRPDRDPGDPERLYQDLRAVEGLMVDPEQKRRFQVLLAEGCRFHDLGVDRVLNHLRAALATGTGDRMNRARLRFQIAGTALEAGDRTLAADQYRAFLEEYPRDDRAYMVRGLLQQIVEGSDHAR